MNNLRPDLNPFESQNSISMFSFKERSDEQKISISVGGSNPSAFFAINKPGITGDVELVKDKRYNIGYHITLGPGKVCELFQLFHFITHPDENCSSIALRLSPSRHDIS